MKDVIIAGGGIAGLISAIALSKNGYDVMLIEKKTFPQHKVCGEYISNEVNNYLSELGVYPDELRPTQLSRFQLSSTSGRSVIYPLDPGGFGVSRYAFDNFLYEKAKQAGAILRTGDVVDAISFEGDQFMVGLQGGEVFNAKVVIGAFGKRSILDKHLDRPFMKKKSPYLAVKYHFKFDYPDDLISLHNFIGGYCGMSKVEDGILNLCYLCERKYLKQAGNISALENKVLSENPFLKEVFNNAIPLYDKPLVINEISFAKKSAVENHVMMTGDSAGLITPVCGNGMAMAIHGAKMAGELTDKFLRKEINRFDLEDRYRKMWSRQFNRRLWVGRNTQQLFGKRLQSQFAVALLQYSKPLGRAIIKATHGNPF